LGDQFAGALNYNTNCVQHSNSYYNFENRLIAVKCSNHFVAQPKAVTADDYAENSQNCVVCYQRMGLEH
jgi:hypothetical protein